MLLNSSCSDEELLDDVEQAADSFALFYRRHVAALIRFVAARGTDVDTAADVVSETFLVALRKRYHYRAAHDTARLWLLGIAARELADARRRRARDERRSKRLAQERLALTDTDHDSYDELRAEAVDLNGLLSDLPSAQRAAVTARVIGEQEYAEVARLLGISETATRKNVSRGLATLRARLERN